jgi:hypothetical protein
MQGMEYGPSGPTQIKDINPAGTGLTDVAAAFIAANASPFTNPRDMPTLAKVPDPRNTQNTKTMYIWAHFDIPTISMSGAGQQIVMTAADPLAPIPITWANTGVNGTSASRMNPNKHARRYEEANMHQMVYQQRELGRRAKSYRVVGHGLKVWCSKNTSISRGNIEAGQFTCAESKNIVVDNLGLTQAVAVEPSGTVVGSTLTGTEMWNNAPGLSQDLGWQATALQTANITNLRHSILNAKDQDIGFLAADEGATVRWTDSNNFEFQPSVDRGCIYPNAYTYPQLGLYPWSTVNYALPTDMGTALQSKFAPSFAVGLELAPPEGGGATGINSFNDVNALGTIIRCSPDSTGVNSAYYTPWITRVVAADRIPQINYYAFGDNNDPTKEFKETDPFFYNYVTDPNKQFNKGLFVDVQGVDTTQTLTVQVCWHVEYIPTSQEPWDSQPSPVDTSYEILSTLLRDRRAFPIVVKGHSFFSSLRKAFAKAGQLFQRGVGAMAPIASSILSSIPDPRAQAAGMAIGGLGALMGPTAKRAREVDLD